MTIKISKKNIDFDKIKKGTEKIEEFDITVTSTESTYTLIAPDGYEFIHPITLERVKRMILNTTDLINDIYLLDHNNDFILDHNNQKIDI